MAKRGTALPWSYSKLNAYEQCPRQFYFQQISKEVVDKPSEQILHGREFHTSMEHAVAGKVPMPDKYPGFQPMIDKLREAPGAKFVEYKFGLTVDLRACDFWDRSVWVRGAIDYASVTQDSAVVIDYKTGKRKPDIDQLRLFALAAFAHWPTISKVSTGYLWLKEKKLDKETFTPEHKIEIHRDFAGRVARLEASEKNDSWPPRPSGLCREWCHVGRARCEHCGK